MLKKTVVYDDIDLENLEDEEVQIEEVKRFVFTICTIKNYEQKTGKNFWHEYSKAFQEVSAVSSLKLTSEEDLESMSVEDQMKLLPLLSSPTINEFMLDLVPCLYAEIEGGRYVQTLETVEEAENSMWIMQLVNVTFFGELISEITANQTTKATKKTKSKKK